MRLRYQARVNRLWNKWKAEEGDPIRALWSEWVDEQIEKVPETEGTFEMYPHKHCKIHDYPYREHTSIPRTPWLITERRDIPDPEMDSYLEAVELKQYSAKERAYLAFGVLFLD